MLLYMYFGKILNEVSIEDQSELYSLSQQLSGSVMFGIDWIINPLETESTAFLSALWVQTAMCPERTK